MPKLPPRSRGSRRFYIERKSCPKLNFLSGDLGFLDCTFSHIDPLDKLELKKIQKVTSEVISDVRNAEVARGHVAAEGLGNFTLRERTVQKSIFCVVGRAWAWRVGGSPAPSALFCTCPDASAEGAHFSALVPTTKVLWSKSSGQEMKSAHLRRTRRDKCRLGASLDFPTGHEPRKIVGTSEQFSKSFFKVFLGKNFFLDIFWRSFRGL